MKTSSLIATALALSIGLAPLSAFAASTTDAVTEDEVMKAIDVGGGGGGEMYYPAPYGGGITVDTSITREVTPDFVAVNGYCEITGLDTRDDVRQQLTNTYNAVKAAVGRDGRVRRSGSPSVYPFYDYTGTSTNKVSGSINIFIRVTNVGAAQRIADILDEHACSPGWDVRLVDTVDYETALLDDLLVRLNKRKSVFEKLLGKKLTNVTGAYLSTWLDGYSSYDPETNMADATTTLSITFDVGSATIPTPAPRPRG